MFPFFVVVVEQMSIHEWDSEWNRLSSTPYTLVDAKLADLCLI
jgi:hypothetical protein